MNVYIKDIFLRKNVFKSNVKESRKTNVPGWKTDKLPSVCPNTSLPFLVGCHLKRQMSDRKEWASLCTVTPGSRPPYTQIYSGPRWETNATPSVKFQHQLTDVGTPGEEEETLWYFMTGGHRSTLITSGVDHTSTFRVVQSGYSLLFCYVPHDEQVIGRGWRKQVRVVRTPADGCDGLLVLRHDGPQLKLIVLLVQLRQWDGENDKEKKERVLLW